MRERLGWVGRVYAHGVGLVQLGWADHSVYCDVDPLLLLSFESGWPVELVLLMMVIALGGSGAPVVGAGLAGGADADADSFGCMMFGG